MKDSGNRGQPQSGATSAADESVAITAFYHFAPIPAEDQQKISRELHEIASRHSGLGLILMAPDGWNGTVAGSESYISALKEFAAGHALLSETEFKDSTAIRMPFRRFKIDPRSTIIDMGTSPVSPLARRGRYLDPAEWDQMLERADPVVLDVRNKYEWEIGIFPDAICPPIEKFNQFEEYVRNAEIPKDKPVLMYCTGGVRCEKASLLMEELGYDEVYQLAGGILRYLEERPSGKFQGECFVFDGRVAVDKDLKPSSIFGRCPHCGNAGDSRISCSRCGEATNICTACSSIPARHTCSKNCRYHAERSLGRSQPVSS